VRAPINRVIDWIITKARNFVDKVRDAVDPKVNAAEKEGRQAMHREFLSMGTANPGQVDKLKPEFDGIRQKYGVASLEAVAGKTHWSMEGKKIQREIKTDVKVTAISTTGNWGSIQPNTEYVISDSGRGCSLWDRGIAKSTKIPRYAKVKTAGKEDLPLERNGKIYVHVYPAADSKLKKDGWTNVVNLKTVGQVDWFADNFKITHYTFALERDPLYAHQQKTETPTGLDGKTKYRKSFLYGSRGIRMQGTGLGEDGQYITLDWGKCNPRTDKNEDLVFKYGKGGVKGEPQSWKSVACDRRLIGLGANLEIEVYKSRGHFSACDTGSRIQGHHLDVFVGEATVAEANALGTKYSKVGVVL